MADKVLSQQTKLGHTFLNAMWIAGFVAILQLSAVLIALFERSSAGPVTSVVDSVGDRTTQREPGRDPGKGQSSASTPTNRTAPPKATSIDLPGMKPSGQSIEAGNRMSSSQGSRIKKMTAPDLSGIKDPVGIIEDSLIERLVTSGIFDRSRGNLTGALSTFRDADLNVPNHPRILAEIAGTLTQSGDLSEAERYWRRVTELGPVAGGAYYQVADRMLKGEHPFLPSFREGQYLRLGDIETRRETQGSESGEIVTLLVSIFGNPEVTLTPGDLNLQVYFFDLIDGRTPGPSTAKVSYRFPSRPYDWREQSVEQIEVVYEQSVFGVEEREIRGERVYFGYVIELYYQNQQQDSVVSPARLKEFQFPAKAPVEEPPPPPRGPDPSLFPINR